MAPRQPLTHAVQDEVLVASHRKCCLCYFLLDDKGPRKGQIAHINGRREDGRIENLVWLCFDHHDEFDSSTRQSKGLTPGEVRHYRDRMIAELAVKYGSSVKVDQGTASLDLDAPPKDGHPWRFPLWLTADRPELFAYEAPAADGICAIERIDLPDGRIAIACIQVPGNPGRSITNSAEYIHAQVCDRFNLQRDNLVWLENYEFFDRAEWRMVRFAPDTVDGLGEPTWEKMTPKMWLGLQLSPKKRLSSTSAGQLRSKIRKHFSWPPSDPALGSN